jgi:hypothetical protein
MAEQYRIGTALVKVFSIQSTAAAPSVIDISSLYSDFSYYESIDSPSVSITASIVDSANLKGSLPIVGGEGIVYEFSDSMQNSLQIKGVSRVFKMNNRVRLKKGTDSYNIICTTNEFLRDQYTIVDQTYNEFTAAELVAKIVENFITPDFGKTLQSIDETDGIVRHTFTRTSPFTAIKLLAQESKSSDEKSSSVFFFFENADGYHFRSLESLFAAPPIKTFYYIEDQVGGATDSIVENNRITSIQEETGFDILSGVNRGEFGVLVSAYDPIAKQFTKKTYSHQIDYATSTHVGGGKDILSASMSQEVGASPSFEKYIVTNSNAANIDYVVENFPELQQTARKRQDFLHTETAAAARIDSRTLKFAIKGDSSLRAGQTINIFYPPSGESRTDKATDRYISGKYLITALAHRITQDGNYATTIECTKDSYDQSIILGEF